MYRFMIVALALLAFVSPAFGTTYYVNGASGSCSDSNNGTSDATPFCTIDRGTNSSAAAAGNTTIVRAHTYREEVSIDGGGTSGNPFVLQADSGVIIDGSENYSNTSLWSQVTGTNTYLADTVNWDPKQVFKDGFRLTVSMDAPASMLANTFKWVSGTGLYVNVGGDNPGSHSLQVSKRDDGLRADRKSYITIDGFTIARVRRKAIFMRDSGNPVDPPVPTTECTGIIVKNNNVYHAYEYGIQFESCVSGTILNNQSHDNRNHGIALTKHSDQPTGSDSNTVDGNDTWNNGYQAASSPSAVGFRVENSDSVTFKNNMAYSNQDSGFEAVSGADSALYVNNLSFKNGQHGFDHNEATFASHVNDLSWGNAATGFNFENVSTDGKIHNSVASNHQYGYNLQMSDNSRSGFASNYNIYWNTPNPPAAADARIKWCLATCTTYQHVKDSEGTPSFNAATGNEANGSKSDPLFANAFGGDFMPRLSPTVSPLIDSADASVTGWSSTDALGKSRFDEPSVTNGGACGSPCGDRGPVEAVR